MSVDEKIRRGKGVDIERGRTGNVNSAPPGFPRRLISFNERKVHLSERI